jgi:lysophospholipase L1-like esterase
MRILFAHQSVGFDILDGIRTIASADKLEINIQETRTPPATGPGLFHFKVGHNEAPYEKIADFSRTVESGAVSGMDAAILKLCYIDFSADTDAPALARKYIDTLKAAQAANPGTAFIAVTAPLTVTQTGPKAWVKQLLGRAPAEAVENARRHAFNERLRAEIPAGRLFDIAKLESGSVPESLDPRLTVDGGHLNDRGKSIVASAFIQFLAGLPVGPR